MRQGKLVLAGMVLLAAISQLDAADISERMSVGASSTRTPSATVRVTDHAVPSVAPGSDADQQERTLLDLFSSWIGGDDDDDGDPAAAVKIEPMPEGGTDLVVIPEGTDRAAIVPIDPAPKSSAALPRQPPLLSASRGRADGWEAGLAEHEPLGVVTTQLVSTSLVTAALWGKSVSAEEEEGDELDRLARLSARRLERPMVLAPRRLVERAMPPLKAGRVITSQEGVDLLTPIGPAAASAISGQP